MLKIKKSVTFYNLTKNSLKFPYLPYLLTADRFIERNLYI